MARQALATKEAAEAARATLINMTTADAPLTPPGSEHRVLSPEPAGQDDSGDESILCWDDGSLALGDAWRRLALEEAKSMRDELKRAKVPPKEKQSCRCYPKCTCARHWKKGRNCKNLSLRRSVTRLLRRRRNFRGP